MYVVVVLYLIYTADVAYMPQSAVYIIYIGHVRLCWRGSDWIPKMDPIDITFNIIYIYIKILHILLAIQGIINADVAYAKSALLLH